MKGLFERVPSAKSLSSHQRTQPAWGPDEGFSTVALLIFVANLFLAVWTYPMHYRMYSSIFGLYPGHASGTLPIPPGRDNQNVFRHC